MKRGIFKKIVCGLSFTSVLFVFQACYGSPSDLGLDVWVRGIVKSKTTGKRIPGIKVSSGIQYDLTDSDGYFAFYLPKEEEITISFEDIDSVDNRQFLAKDTILNCRNEQRFLLEIELEEAE